MIGIGLLSLAQFIFLIYSQLKSGKALKSEHRKRSAAEENELVKLDATNDVTKRDKTSVVQRLVLSQLQVISLGTSIYQHNIFFRFNMAGL